MRLLRIRNRTWYAFWCEGTPYNGKVFNRYERGYAIAFKPINRTLRVYPSRLGER